MGRRSVRLNILRQSDGARNGFNEPATAWPVQGTAWAHRADLSDTEAVAAGQQAGARLVQFTMRFNAVTNAITSDDRLAIPLTGEEFKVTGKRIDPRGRSRDVVVTAIQRSDQDRA